MWVYNSKYNILLISLIFVLSLSNLFAQSNFDSIYHLFINQKNDSLKEKLLFNYALQLKQNDKLKSLKFKDFALPLYEKFFPDKTYSYLVLIGDIYFDRGEYEVTADYYYQALKLAQEQSCLNCELYINNNIAFLLLEQNQLQKALKLSYDISEKAHKLGNKQEQAVALAHLSFIYIRLNKPDSAKIFIDKVFDFGISNFDKSTQLGIYDAAGMAMDANMDFNASLKHYRKALEIAKELNERSEEGFILSHMARPFFWHGKVDSCELSMLESIKIADEIGDYRLKVGNYEGLSELHDSLGNHEKALRYYQQFKMAMDTLQQGLYKESIAEMEAKYQKQEQESKIQEQELTIARQENAQKNILIGVSSILLIFIGAFQFIRNRQKIKQKESQLALQLKNAEAENLKELDQIKSTFFTNISHEFRTPLTLIKTPLQDLIKGKLKGNIQKYYRIMDRNADRLLILVNQLLDLAKLESGKMELKASKGDIVKLVQALTFSFESLAMKKEIKLKINIPETPIYAWYDKDKLEKILTNLLSNAFKFTKEEGQIKVAVFENEKNLKIIIEDNGIGIPPDQLPHVFDRFYHSTETSEVQASSGIGLALTKELIELHHGTIEVKSEEEKGSLFTVFLPIGNSHLKPAEMVEAVEAKSSPINEEAGRSEDIVSSTDQGFKTTPPAQSTFLTVTGNAASKPLVLVVEDNPDVRTYILDQIGDAHKVLDAENGKIGLEIATRHIPDLIISDVMMPEMDGTELCKHLKTNNKTSHIPVIMLTAKADRSDKLQGLQIGADDYLTKPFDAEELMVRMNNLISQRKHLREKFTHASPFKPKEIAVNSVDELFLKDVLTTIEENMDDEEFSIEQLASAAAMSRSQLHRKIKALTGVSPSVFMRTVRLERGRQLLEQKAGNASEVAFMVGFNSSTYFAKCFKDQYGISPIEAVQ